MKEHCKRWLPGPGLSKPGFSLKLETWLGVALPKKRKLKSPDLGLFIAQKESCLVRDPRVGSVTSWEASGTCGSGVSLLPTSAQRAELPRPDPSITKASRPPDTQCPPLAPCAGSLGVARSWFLDPAGASVSAQLHAELSLYFHLDFKCFIFFFLTGSFAAVVIYKRSLIHCKYK